MLKSNLNLIFKLKYACILILNKSQKIRVSKNIFSVQQRDTPGLRIKIHFIYRLEKSWSLQCICVLFYKLLHGGLIYMLCPLAIWNKFFTWLRKPEGSRWPDPLNKTNKFKGSSRLVRLEWNVLAAWFLRSNENLWI